MIFDYLSKFILVLHLVTIPMASARAAPRWTFDWTSAAIGFVAGALAALIVYLLRHRLAALRERVISTITHLRNRVSMGAADRYREYIIDKAERGHLLRHLTPLSQVFVEPRFNLPPFSIESAPDEDQDAKLWRQQRLYDLFYPRSRSIRFGNALKQSSRLAILGPVGSGRTTMLLHIGWQFARREGWQMTMAEPQENETAQTRATRNRERERLPVWIDLASLNLSLADEQSRHALVKPITDYLSTSLPLLIAAASTATVRAQIIEGRTLLLCDNLDLLDAEARQRTLDWLNKLNRAYEGNVVIIAGQPEGYADLVESGFGILFLNGFDRRLAARFATQWQHLCEAESLRAWEAEAQAARVALDEAKKRARALGQPPPDEAEYPLPEMPTPRPPLLTVWREGSNENVLPIDLAMAALLWRNQEQVSRSRLMRFAQTTIQVLGQTQDGVLSLPNWGQVLGALAWSMHERERYAVERSDLETRVLELLTKTAAPPVETENESAEQGTQRTTPDMSRTARAAVQTLLQHGNLLVDAGRGQIAFVHSTFRAYLAAQYAARNDLGEVLKGYIRVPHWQETIRFFAALTSPQALVVERSKGTDDLWRSDLFATAEYLIASPEGDRQMLIGMLNELSRLLTAATQPIALRRRAATVLARADAKGALRLFGQMVQNANAQLRALGVYGFSLLEDERVIAGLNQALSDPDPLVRSSAVYALSRYPDERAIEGLIQGLQDEDDLVRRTAAEGLSLWPNEGHSILREAVKGQDMYIRRAAVFGLGQIEEPWAVAIVDSLSREDKEWFVRSAATEVIETLNAGTPPLRPQQSFEELGWLMAWAAQQGTTLGHGDAAYQMLLRALREGSWSIRLAAADTLQALGDQHAIAPLLPLLNDQDFLVRNAAYNALSEIGRRTGERIMAQNAPET